MRNAFGFAFYPGRRLPVLCRDGRQRMATLTGHATQCVPAFVQIRSGGRRVSISGNVWTEPGRPDCFSFTASGRNADLMPLVRHVPQAANLARFLIEQTEGGFMGKRFSVPTPAAHATELAKFCRAASVVNAAGGFAHCRRLPDVSPGHERSCAVATLAAAWPAMRQRVRHVTPARLLRTAGLFLKLKRFLEMHD